MEYWSWILGFVGIAGFILAGKKVWWTWYINIAAQGLWFTYAIFTNQPGFLASSVVYTAVFSRNAYLWTKERNIAEKSKDVDLEPICTECHRPIKECLEKREPRKDLKESLGEEYLREAGIF